MNPLFEPGPRWVVLPGDPPALRRWLEATQAAEATASSGDQDGDLP
jgi:hypothetical protein